jgi:stage II sporulation protein D
MLLTTESADGLLKEGDTAWSKAKSLLGGPLPSSGPVVQELPTTELFRQTTGEPGWMLASTRGQNVFLQPRTIRESHGGTRPLLLHEFLHVMVESEAGEKAPLWLREGLVEILADPDFGRPVSGLSPRAVDAALQHPADADAAREAHRAAAQLTAMLRARYGLASVRGFLRNGVPAEALRLPPG